MSKLDDIEAISSRETCEPDELLNLAADQDGEVRLRAVEALAGFHGDSRVRHCVRTALLTDADELVRCESAEILGDWKDREALPDLIRALDDPEWLVRAAAALAVARIGADEAADPLARKELQAQDEEERIRFDVALWYLGRVDFKSRALAGLASENYRVRCATANMIADFADRLADEEVRQRLKETLAAEETVAGRSSLSRAVAVLEDVRR